MNRITWLVHKFSKQARAKRAEIFRQNFYLDENTKILDLGSESGANINAVLQGTKVRSENVYIADIDAQAVTKGSSEFGFNPVIIGESDKLPFQDNFFDIVYCSSVIEHVTISKNRVWSLHSGSQFKVESLRRQKDFAGEINRLGRQYFVQTPYKYFPIESHSWLPIVGMLPRRALVPILRLSNRVWIKETSPDWHLLNKREMRNFFCGADIQVERKFGLIKSIIAVKRDNFDLKIRS